MHITVLLHEAVDALEIKLNGTYVDATFGYGGHSRQILKRLGRNGRLIAFDRDPIAVMKGRDIEDVRFCIVHSKFSQIQRILQKMNVNQVDGILLDLGVSSTQLEEASRGFSFRSDGPLDMRMDTSTGQTATEWLASVPEKKLGQVIKEYSEERFAKNIARAVVAARMQQPIVTTLQLSTIVATAVRSREPNQNPATRTFQAIRIYLNQELEELSSTLPQCLELLNLGGRLVTISFHSLEDRIVKHFMRAASNPDTLPKGVPLRAREVRHLSCQKLQLMGKAIRPKTGEIVSNARARSAVMRVAERIDLNNCGA
ncbi:MAG: 16S rRNA (cytosine(1402)-N(4))-methyltransferase RsmH [Nitrosospira sp.]|nr:16S rRNA (cytosine(1402)-N(4))-methyltransferase RsmH [Nitrosospira sp.]MBI0407866.1 16S rRNA (cytosine(1402)-N(4))-methyltransferase RsmH [Nitrosospira sp.]MBI0414876.1 16S rRNA (cytosine(1402)-N(4))-methyltransferase RsmH [Nitrosospira sp.]MBI0416645.1 16S rRNA (cytosine(1402)-N(4))-methyltransferase RsmH [Nitrosospira sp.]MBI0418151.1 16S rRNA (cytosine(1402)-N(4))-methyltransferase RsmH [Nitrosospira sp.]